MPFAPYARYKSPVDDQAQALQTRGGVRCCCLLYLADLLDIEGLSYEAVLSLAPIVSRKPQSMGR